MVNVNYTLCTLGLICCVLFFLGIGVGVRVYNTTEALFLDVGVDSDDTTISFNFKGENVTVLGNISVIYKNNEYRRDIFFNTSVAFYYKLVADKQPEEEEEEEEKFLMTSTYLTPVHMGNRIKVKIPDQIHLVGRLNQTIGDGDVKIFLSLSASLDHDKYLSLIARFCYPHKSQVSLNPTNNATTVLLTSISCD